MKTKETTAILPPYTRVKIPAGLRVIPASNLPADSTIKYWLDELTPEMEENPVIESYHRNYGIGLTADEVEVSGN